MYVFLDLAVRTTSVISKYAVSTTISNLVKGHSVPEPDHHHLAILQTVNSITDNFLTVLFHTLNTNNTDLDTCHSQGGLDILRHPERHFLGDTQPSSLLKAHIVVYVHNLHTCIHVLNNVLKAKSQHHREK